MYTFIQIEKYYNLQVTLKCHIKILEEYSNPYILIRLKGDVGLDCLANIMPK